MAVTDQRRTRLPLSPLWFLVALTTLIIGKTVSNGSAHSAETRVRAIVTPTAITVGSETTEPPGSVGCLRPETGDLVSGSCVATNTAGSGAQHSVAYEMQLDSSVLGRSRSVHFNRANQALDEAMAADSAFAGQIESMIPGVKGSVGAAGGRQTPDGWVWHDAPSANAGGRSGVMQLVPTAQHTPGSAFWPTLDPGGVGGYSEWAIPAGAPKN
jgi:DNase/tRNase domain of colicin-like bacteriocin